MNPSLRCKAHLQKHRKTRAQFKACKRAFQPVPTCMTRLGLDDIVLVHLDCFKTNPTHNTDNKVHKLVTVFAFAPTTKTNL
jgi:hypothetical protein